jgi:hypothetical protein
MREHSNNGREVFYAVRAEMLQPEQFSSLNHIIIKVELYIAQSGLTQCYNCQNFSHVWANCKKPPRCIWYGGAHLHRECPEKTNTQSTPSSYNCTPLEREKPQLASCRGRSHATREQQRRRAQRVPKRSTGRTFFCKFTSPEQSYAAAIRQDTSNHMHRIHIGKACGPPSAASATAGNSVNRSVSTGSQFD